MKEGTLTSVIVFGLNTASAYVIPAIGFAKTGVVAGSYAAVIQSGMGSVAAGSSFALAQSLGALGLGFLGTVALPVALGTGVAVGGYRFCKYVHHLRPRPKLWSDSFLYNTKLFIYICL